MHTDSAKRVLITGATGCVGQYLVEDLLANTSHHLVLIVRNPAKLPDFGENSTRITAIVSDVADFASYRDRLGKIDAAFLVAAAWGGPEAETVNLTANLAITDHMASAGGGRIYYFSTGSVLSHDHGLLPAAFELGSPYVQSKYRLVEEIEKRADSIEIIGLFPTIVVGGGPDGKPRSHFANLLHEVRPYMRLACSLSADGKLHHIHARDISVVARVLLDSPQADGGLGRRIVIGNPAVTVNQLIDGVRRYYGYRLPLRFKLRDGLAEFFIKLFRIQLAPWDRYCMKHRDMSYTEPVHPATFELPVYAPDIGAQLRAVGL